MSSPKHSILLVDDSATMLMSLSCLLGDRGYSVHTARDGAIAMTLLKGGLRPALIITDIAMPNMDGIEFTRQARSLLRFVPILVLTTQCQRDKRDQGKQLGATGWLIKPVDVDQLFRIIDQVLPASARSPLPGVPGVPTRPQPTLTSTTIHKNTN